jgi:NAD(P)H-dependent FMN reductase
VHDRRRVRELSRERVLPAEAIVFATPLYGYGVSGQLKTFLIDYRLDTDRPGSVWADAEER